MTIKVIGPDVSFYQDTPTTPTIHIDFGKMRDAGAQFVIIRAGQNTWPDRDFKMNYEAARIAGLPRGVYWFYDSRAKPVDQARLLLSLLSTNPELGVWADFEESYNGPYRGVANWKLFLEALKVKLPRVGIYTAYYYWIDNGPKTSADLTYFKQYPLWIANYKVTKPSVPAPWLPDDWLFWQYTSSEDGLRFGAESKEIDMNLYNGDYESFCKYFNLDQSEPEEDNTMSEDLRYLADQIYKGLHEIAEAKGTSGGGEDPVTPPTPAAKESIYQVVEKDANPNGMVVVYKTPDVNETNTDRFSIPPAQVVRAINDWRDVPSGLVGWSKMSDIDKQNTYLTWVCLHEDQIKNANGKWRAFPDIWLAQGTTRAEYCWMPRSCLGSKVG